MIRVVYFDPDLYPQRTLMHGEKRVLAVVLFGCITIYRAAIQRA
ncbi:hypothetical protein [Burkholderia ubonensis]|nr:hypothetical protein [Burkholderia ubonensis]